MSSPGSMTGPLSVELDALDAKVQAAAAEIERLRAVNRELGHRLEDAERRLAAVETAAGDSGWQRERDEIRERVASLVGKLDSLLET